MPRMIEVVIDSVRVSLMSPQRVVVLRQVDQERYLPIWVGPYEAEAITVALQEIEMIRPLTHDLLKNVIATFGARIKRVEIISLREDIFYGNVVAEQDGKEIQIDSRPSDAIALAVRERFALRSRDRLGTPVHLRGFYRPTGSRQTGRRGQGQTGQTRQTRQT
jgi:bifunctional DNase/RNase